MVILKDPLGLADDAASTLRRAATMLRGASPRLDRDGAMRCRSLGRASAKLHHDERRGRLLLEVSMGLAVGPSVIVQMRHPVLGSRRCSPMEGEIVDLLTCAAILLEGGAGPLDEWTAARFSIVENICSAEPDRLHALPMLHSGNAYEDAYLWDEGMNGRRVMKVSPATAEAMALLPLVTGVDVDRTDGKAMFIAMDHHCEGYGSGPASPLEVLRLHAELALARRCP